MIRLPESELEIMLIIWRHGEKVSTSDIMNCVERGQSVQLIQSYLKRLEEKKFVLVEKLGRLNFYTPIVKLDDYRNQQTTDFIGNFYDKSAVNLFVSLVKNKKISQEEQEKIKQFIERIE